MLTVGRKQETHSGLRHFVDSSVTNLFLVWTLRLENVTILLPSLLTDESQDLNNG